MWVRGVRAARGGAAGAAHVPAAGEGSAREGRRVGRRLTARLAFSGLRRDDMGFFCAKIREYGPQGLPYVREISELFAKLYMPFLFPFVNSFR